MEHVFSCAFASGCEFTTKNKNSVRKKIVRERYVFAGPLRSALPPPPWPEMPLLPVGFYLVAVGRVGHVDNVDHQLQVARPRNVWTMWTIILQ
jgi:hypothetical protein